MSLPRGGAVAVGCVRLGAGGQERFVLAQAGRFPRARIPGRVITRDPGNWRPCSPALEVRLRAAQRRADLPKISWRWCCRRCSPARTPGAHLAVPRRLSEVGVVAAVVAREVAIGATDSLRPPGTAIGLNLLFAIPLEIGVVITALDVLSFALQALGFRWIESKFVVALLGDRRPFRDPDRHGRSDWGG